MTRRGLIIAAGFAGAVAIYAAQGIGGGVNAYRIRGVPISATAPANGNCLAYASPPGQWQPGACGGAITLQTNGANNASQNALNLVAGANVTLTNTSGGNVSIAASGGGSGSTLLYAQTVPDVQSASNTPFVTNYTFAANAMCPVAGTVYRVHDATYVSSGSNDTSFGIGATRVFTNLGSGGPVLVIDLTLTCVTAGGAAASIEVAGLMNTGPNPSSGGTGAAFVIGFAAPFTVNTTGATPLQFFSGGGSTTQRQLTVWEN